MCMCIRTGDYVSANYQLIMSGVVDLAVALLAAAIIGFVGYLFKEKIVGYVEKAKLLDRLGITQLINGSLFATSEFGNLITNAERIQVFYRTGRKFWNRLCAGKDSSLLATAFDRNSDLIVQVILADPDSEVLKKISEAERVVGSRGEGGINWEHEEISEEITYVENILKRYPKINCKFDVGFYNIPFLLITYKNKKNERRIRAYAGLNVQPLLSINSLTIVSDCPLENDVLFMHQDEEFHKNAKLAEQLELSFQAAWHFAKDPKR